MANDDVKNIAGKDLRVKRGTGATASLVAAAKTKSLQFVNELGETTTHDPNAPDAVPWRTSLLTSRAWMINISGAADTKRFNLLQADATTAIDPVDYTLEIGGGGGTVAGGVWVENLQIQSQNMGVVEFTCQLRGNGKPNITPAA